MDKEYETMEGFIESKSQKSGTTNGKEWVRTVFQINNKTLSTFNEQFAESYKSNDYVEVTFSKSGKYNNIEEMDFTDRPIQNAEKDFPEKVAEEIVKDGTFKANSKEPNAPNAPNALSVWDMKDIRMVRMNALTQANAFLEMLAVTSKESTFQTITNLLATAKKIEEWVWRDMGH